MKCKQCNHDLIEPRDDAPYCDQCGFPDDNRCVFTLVEIKAYMQSMFKTAVSCGHARGGILENNRLACAFNLITDDAAGIARFCDDGKADGKTLEKFATVPLA